MFTEPSVSNADNADAADSDRHTPPHPRRQRHRTVALGKIFHVYAKTGLGSEDDPASWSEPHWLPAALPRKP